MAEAIAMMEDILTAITFLGCILKNKKNIAPERLDRFNKSLASVLCERFIGHWYPECPMKGQAYRCIRINSNSPVDESLLKACEEAGIEYSDLQMPPEFTLWIDPGDVSCRLGENSEPFQVGDEYRSGKSSPDMTTSDYHSCGSPSECVSEDEPQPCTQKNIPERPQRSMVPQDKKLWWSSTTQAPGSWIPSPVWVPCDRNMVLYSQPHQPGVLYFLNLPWRPSTTRRLSTTRRPNPDLIKRLTGRACRK